MPRQQHNDPCLVIKGPPLPDQESLLIRDLDDLMAELVALLGERPAAWRVRQAAERAGVRA